MIFTPLSQLHIYQRKWCLIDPPGVFPVFLEENEANQDYLLLYRCSINNYLLMRGAFASDELMLVMLHLYESQDQIGHDGKQCWT